MPYGYNSGYGYDSPQWDPEHPGSPEQQDPNPGGPGGGGETPPPPNAPPNTNCPSGQDWNNAHNKCMPTCPTGTTRAGNADGQCTPIDYSPGPGQGGNNGGSGGSGGYRPTGGNGPNIPKPTWEEWVPPTKTPFELNLEDELSGFLDDWDKRIPFTADIVRNMKTGARRNAYGSANADKQAIEADAIERGVYQGDHTGDRLDNARRGYQSQFANDSRNIDTNAAVANDAAVFRNRTAALDRAMSHVNKEREFLLASEMSHFERQKGMAEISLAYYNLEMQKWALTNEWNLKKYGIDENSKLANRGMDMEWFWRMMNDAA